jgi:hypothetical protein
MSVTCSIFYDYLLLFIIVGLIQSTQLSSYDRNQHLFELNEFFHNFFFFIVIYYYYLLLFSKTFLKKKMK